MYLAIFITTHPFYNRHDFVPHCFIVPRYFDRSGFWLDWRRKSFILLMFVVEVKKHYCLLVFFLMIIHSPNVINSDSVQGHISAKWLSMKYMQVFITTLNCIKIKVETNYSITVWYRLLNFIYYEILKKERYALPNLTPYTMIQAKCVHEATQNI